MRVTARDIDMMQLVGRFRFINTDYLHVYEGGSKVNLRRRLKLLWMNGYLDRPKIQIDYYIRGGGSQPMIYALTNKSAKLLHEISDIPLTKRQSWNQKNKEVGHPFIQHQLMTAGFASKLFQATQQADHVRLYDFQDLVARLPEKTQAKSKPMQLSTTLILRNTGALEIKIDPDYVFSLDWLEFDKRGNFFVEMDRGTMPIESDNLERSSIIRKLYAYQSYYKTKGLAKEELNWLAFRVLIITESRIRADNIRKAMKKYHAVANSPLFLFTSIEEIEDNIFAHKFLDYAGQAQTLTP